MADELNRAGLLDAVGRAHPHEPPHWYLMLLGTDPVLQGRTVSLTPAVNEDGDISWVCGYADVPEGYAVSREEYQRFTNIPADALPATCVPADASADPSPASQSVRI